MLRGRYTQLLLLLLPLLLLLLLLMQLRFAAVGLCAETLPAAAAAEDFLICLRCIRIKAVCLDTLQRPQRLVAAVSFVSLCVLSMELRPQRSLKAADINKNIIKIHQIYCFYALLSAEKSKLLMRSAASR